MAEFSEVMRQWKRMCEHSDCGSCEITVKHTGYPCVKCVGELSENDLRQIERIVMQWAADNPEPVYPTWLEWFDTFDEGIDVDEPIPADIAEKLGIEPKEG